MARLVLTIDKKILQETNVKRFVANTDKVLGLVEDQFGVKVSILGENGVVNQCYVEESFEEIADAMIYGEFDAERD